MSKWIFQKISGDQQGVSEPQGPESSKLDWRYFEHNKDDRNEFQVRKSLHKGT